MPATPVAAGSRPRGRLPAPIPDHMIHVLTVRNTTEPQRSSGRRGRPPKGVEVTVDRPSGEPPTLRDAVLYPAGDTVEIRALDAGDDAGLRLTIRGAARQALKPGSLLLSPQAELLTARRAVVRGTGLEGTRTITGIPRPGQPDAPIAAVRCALERLPAAPELYLLKAERPLPLIPGRSYRFAAAKESRGAPSTPGIGVVVLAGPQPPDILPAELARLAAGVDPLDAPAVESLFLRVYGIAPRLSPGETGGFKEVHRFTDWLAGAAYIDEIGELLADVLSGEGELPVAALRELAESHRFFVPRTLWRELLSVVAERRGLERRGGVVARRAPTGAAPQLSPAERSVLGAIAAAGRQGEHIKSERMRAARGIVERLLELGLAVKLPNGRIYERGVYRALAGVSGEVDDRRAAKQWGVSRNTARELIDRLVADGLMRRTSPRTAVAAHGEGQRKTEGEG